MYKRQYGQCYYAYKDYIQFPDGLRWVVCDFPSFTQRGEEFAKEQLADALSFTTNRQDANGSLVYLTNGTLQYIETGLAEMLSELAEKPPHVLVNRVPVYSGETYYTVQYGAFSYSPYKVMNAEQLINSMEHLGYRKIDQWSLCLLYTSLARLRRRRLPNRPPQPPNPLKSANSKRLRRCV